MIVASKKTNQLSFKISFLALPFLTYWVLASGHLFPQNMKTKYNG